MGSEVQAELDRLHGHVGAGGILTEEHMNITSMHRQALLPGSLAGGGDSLYAFTGTDLVRIDPASGDVVQAVRFSSPVENQPVILGNRVWVVWAYSGGNVVLRGYDARTLDLRKQLLTFMEERAPTRGAPTGTRSRISLQTQ